MGTLHNAFQSLQAGCVPGVIQFESADCMGQVRVSMVHLRTRSCWDMLFLSDCPEGLVLVLWLGWICCEGKLLTIAKWCNFWWLAHQRLEGVPVTCLIRTCHEFSPLSQKEMEASSLFQCSMGVLMELSHEQGFKCLTQLPVHLQ